MGPTRSREDSSTVRSARERDRRRRSATTQVGEHHSAASDANSEPHANTERHADSHAVAIFIADRFTRRFAVARQLAGSLPRANIRLPASISERFAFRGGIAKAEPEPESFRKSDALAESISVRKILRVAQKEAQQLAL